MAESLEEQLASGSLPSDGGGGEEQLGPAAAYSAAVAEWLNQAYHAQMIQIGFSSFLAQQAVGGQGGGFLYGSIPNSSIPTTFTTTSLPAATATPTTNNTLGQGGNQNINNDAGNNANINNNNTNRPNVAAANEQQNQRNATIQGPSGEQIQTLVYTIPPIWRRLVAEALDFLILFTLKLIITFTAIDFFQVMDLRNYDLDLFLNLARYEDVSLDDSDFEAAVQLTSEIVILEIIHRIVVCLFEALCTQRGPAGLLGGATPGKVLMGLKIVKCDQVISLGGNRVAVATGGNLGLFWATWRSVQKNFCIAFLFPVCFSVLFMPFNRTLYDIMAKSLVVESDYRIQRNRYVN